MKSNSLKTWWRVNGFKVIHAKPKPAQETKRFLRQFLRPEENPRFFYTDNSLEFIKACEGLNWNHGRSTPHRSETNGIVERAARRVKEGTSSALVQSGLQESWWGEAMERDCCLRLVQDLHADGQTPCERRFNSPVEEPIIPFGAAVQFLSYICRRPSSSASARLKNPSFNFHGIRLERERKLDG